ncbi:PREDICTED: inositol 1,4,5-trisphosphate receptor-interacting protein-like 1 [Tauraco erythrolophus]|uniref:inositol 1,4,5-trisphosphate receptor-interacting protein-like 1 n=1 Tax=Tauraco erythrolophus TaxID=121530 RepID=UPI00052389A2|nr:PREDICTED: inositol 1,4,5-trisphosphate receptor-interacting protein-like 1 [Tauraco erythrolophus]
MAVLLSRFLIWHPWMAGDGLDKAMQEHMQQHEEYLNQQMTWLLEEMVQSAQEPSGAARGALLFTVAQQWQFWALVGGLVLLLRFCWWFWKMTYQKLGEFLLGHFMLCWLYWSLLKRNHNPGGSSKHGRRLEEEEAEDSLPMDGFWEEQLWPLPSRESTCMMVEELVNDLLSECQIRSGNAFVPQLQPAVGVGGFQSAHGKDFVYILLVPMKPPPGHSFHLELGTGGEMLVRNSRLRVELECVCTRERQLGDMLCFLHSPREKLMSSQGASLLQNFCTGSYLDVQKTALWLQYLMTAASIAVCEENAYKLTVLPSPRFCRLRLSSSNMTSLTIELILVVPEGNLHTFVTME